MPPVGASSSGQLPSELAAERILVVFEAGRAGVAAVELARELAERDGASVTVVSVAPKAPNLHCVSSAAAYNDAVRDTVAQELEHAEELLWPIGSRGRCRLLVEGTDPSLDELVTREQFDLVLLPGHRRLLRSVKHPAAVGLRRLGAEVRVVDGSSRPAA